MGACGHRYSEPHAACPHAAVEGAAFCLWHNPLVRKDDAYIPALLQSADHQAEGDLDGFLLVGMHWPEAALAGRSLRGVDLRDAVLDVADLSGADLAGAKLRRTSLKRANLQRACLANADLSACNLSGADLREADLKYAILSRTVLNNADLRGADLTDARIDGFLWNGSTRFQGIRGVSEPVLAGEDDETRACLSPMAAGALAPIDDGERSALEDPDPEREATRSFAVLPAVAKPALRTLSLRERLLLTSTCAAILLAGIGFAVGLTPTRPAASTPGDPGDTRLLAEAQAQAAAFQARLSEVETALSNAISERDRNAQHGLVSGAERERLDTLLKQSRSEAARLRSADDQARLALTRVSDLERERDAALTELARQRRIGGILADGARSLTSTSQDQQQRIAELAATADRAELLARELAAARDDLRRSDMARRDAESRVDVLSGELDSVRSALERYLGRVSGTSWQDLLADADLRSPSFPVESGRPVALGGAYAITVRVDQAERPGMIAIGITVQRQIGQTDPDVALVLYDRDQRPMRRMAFSFADSDGSGITSARAEIACATFPTSARILVAPSVHIATR